MSNLTTGYYSDNTTAFSYIRFNLFNNEWLQLEFYTSRDLVSFSYFDGHTASIIWEK